MQPLDAERVREWRHRRMLSQGELAERAGTSLFTIQRIERGEGNVRPKTGRGVAAALGVPIEELLPKAQAPLFRELPEREPADQRRKIEPEVAGLFRNLAKRGRMIANKVRREGPSPELTEQALMFQDDSKNLLRLRRLLPRWGAESDELADAVDAYTEADAQIARMLQQDVEATDEERRQVQRFRQGVEDTPARREADAS